MGDILFAAVNLSRLYHIDPRVLQIPTRNLSGALII